MSNPDFIFVQPLLGADDAWSGYRIEPTPGATATASLLNRLCTSSRFNDFNHRLPWFFPATSHSVELAQTADRIVTIFPAHRPSDNVDTFPDIEAELRRGVHKVGLEATPESKLPGAGSWDYLIIGASHARSLPPYTLLGIASRTQIVSTDLHSQSDREWGLANACGLSTCEFLLVRAATNTKPDITRLKLLKLLALIDGDADTAAMDSVFREESKLSYSLLRLVNSAALAPRSPITSFSQAINLLGRRQLQRWLQLLVYSNPNNGQHPNPLLQKAATRGRLLELLSKELGVIPETDTPGDTAFMIGTFSLLDVLLNMPMPEILQQLPLPEVAQKALLSHEGLLGQLLAGIDAAEKRNLKTASQCFSGLGISGEVHLEAQLEALSWAEKISLPA